MYELTRHHIHCRHKIDTNACDDCHWDSPEHVNRTISFDQKKRRYSLESSGLNLGYWFKMPNEMATENSPKSDSYMQDLIIDNNRDSWCSDDEETLQIHPETIPSSLGTAENWRDDDIHHSKNYGVLDVVTEDDISVVCDSTNNQLVCVYISLRSCKCHYI